MKDSLTHHISKIKLLGRRPLAILVDDLSNEARVNKATPPAFVYHASTDDVVAVANSDLHVQSLRQSGVPVTYVRTSLPNIKGGGHGIGLDPSWTEPLLAWLQQQRF